MSGLAKFERREVTQPLKIVIVGNSASLFVIPDHYNRSDGTYGELLQRMLADDDIAAVVDHQGKWHDMIHELRRRYEFAIRNRFPDVLIINYASAEYQPHTVPTWLVRHMTAWDRSSHPVAVAWRANLAPKIWPHLREYQRRSSAKVGMHTWRLSPKRFGIELTRVITMAREQTGCLVLVLDGDPPGSKFEYWLPGVTKRWEVFQQVFVDVIRDINDPQVRLVETSKTIGDLDEDLPDALHRSPDAHRRAADLIHTEIIKWLDEA